METSGIRSRRKRSSHTHRFAFSRIHPGAHTAASTGGLPRGDLLEPGHLIPVNSRKHAIGIETNWTDLPTLFISHDVIAVQTAILYLRTIDALPYLLLQVVRKRIVTVSAHVLQQPSQRIARLEAVRASEQHRR